MSFVCVISTPGFLAGISYGIKNLKAYTGWGSCAFIMLLFWIDPNEEHIYWFCRCIISFENPRLKKYVSSHLAFFDMAPKGKLNATKKSADGFQRVIKIDMDARRAGLNHIFNSVPSA